MITEFEVPAYLMHELPDIIFEFKYMYPSANIFKTIQCLENYTNQRIMKADLEEVKACFKAAEKLYCDGSLPVKTAIEKVFIHSFPVLSILWKQIEHVDFRSVIPLHLYLAYLQQESVTP